MTPYNFLRGLEKKNRNSKTILDGKESVYGPIFLLFCLNCIALVHFFVLIEHCNLFPKGHLGSEKKKYPQNKKRACEGNFGLLVFEGEYLTRACEECDSAN